MALKFEKKKKKGIYVLSIWNGKYNLQTYTTFARQFDDYGYHAFFIIYLRGPFLSFIENRTLALYVYNTHTHTHTHTML